MAVGTVIGGLAGTAADLFTAAEQRRAEREREAAKRGAVQNALGSANSTFSQIQDLLEGYERNRPRLADDDMVTKLKAAMETYAPGQVYEFGKFGDEYNKTVEDFLNPEAEKIAELAGLKTQAQLAGSGAAKGSGALANLGYSRWDAAEQLYKDAQDAYRQDRQQAYTEYGDYIDRMQKKLDTLSQGQLSKINVLSGAVQNEQQAESDYMADLIGVLGDKASTNINATIGAF